MKSEKNKLIRIMDELVSFYLKHDNHQVDISLSMTPECGEVKLKGYFDNISQQRIDELSAMINEPRKDDAEEYYWNLMGPSEYSELNLLAVMVDEGEIEYRDQILTILVRRHI